MNFLRPYLAVIKDSFRAAIATRVLYVMLAAITIVLVVFAPFRVKRTIYWEFKYEDMRGGFSNLFRDLSEKNDDPKRPDIKKIWTALPDKLRSDIKAEHEKIKEKKSKASEEDEFSGGLLRPSDKGRKIIRQLADEFTSMVQEENFYDKEVWASRVKVDELNNLLEKGARRNEKETYRMNRLLLESSFHSIRISDPTSIQFSYLIWPFPDFNLSADIFEAYVADWLPYVFDKFVMSIGLFIAILVTSNLIPETFNPGTLNLLLSKPIHRWALLLSKFFGGCVFISMCSVYLFVGLWLIMGIQWGIWETSILFSILLYMVVFAIYYSVSVFVGIVFRSAIVSVICTALFWAVCFSTGMVYEIFESGLERNEITKVVTDDGDVYHCDRFGTLHRWNEDEKKWTRHVAPGMMGDQLQAFYIVSYMTPVFGDGDIDSVSHTVTAQHVPEYDVILGGEIGMPPGRPAENPKMFSMGSDGLVLRGRFPRRTLGLVNEPHSNSVLAVTSDGRFYRLTKDPTAFVPPEQNAEKKEDQKKNADDDEDEEEAQRAQQEREKLLMRQKFFEPVGPDNYGPITSSHAFSINSKNNELAVYQQGKVVVYKLNKENKYDFDRQVDLQLGAKKLFSHWIAYAGDYIVVVIGDGQIILVNAETMEDETEFRPESRIGVESLSASSDGKWFAITYQNGNVWMLDCDGQPKLTKPSGLGQGYTTSAVFDSNDRLICGEEFDQVTIYDSGDWKVDQEVRPAVSTQKIIVSYLVRPLYWVCPKPGEFYQLVTYLSLSDKDEEEQEIDWTRTERKKNPWTPLFNGLIFMAFMLLISCVWFQRTDY